VIPHIVRVNVRRRREGAHRFSSPALAVLSRLCLPRETRSTSSVPTSRHANLLRQLFALFRQTGGSQRYARPPRAGAMPPYASSVERRRRQALRIRPPRAAGSAAPNHAASVRRAAPVRQRGVSSELQCSCRRRSATDTQSSARIRAQRQRACAYAHAFSHRQRT